jgi:hypothetical protein
MKLNPATEISLHVESVRKKMMYSIESVGDIFVDLFQSLSVVRHLHPVVQRSTPTPILPPNPY